MKKNNRLVDFALYSVSFFIGLCIGDCISRLGGK